MAILKMDGFDHYTTALNKWPLGYNVATVTFPAGVYSYGYCLQSAGGSPRPLHPFTFTPGAVYYAAFHHRLASAAYQQNLAADPNMVNFYNYSLGVVQIGVGVKGNGAVVVVRSSTYGTAQPILATSSNLLTPNFWYWICIEAKVANVGGYINVYVNGDLWVSYAGDTQYSATDEVSAIEFGRQWAFGNWQFDNLFLFDSTGAAWNSVQPETRVYTQLASANGSINQFTPTGAANNWQCVNSRPEDITKYNSDGTVGDVDLYTFPATAITGTPVIQAVQSNLLSRKDDAGLRRIQTMMRRGGVNTPSPNVNTLNATWYIPPDIMMVDPSTGVVWTLPNVNATEFGATVNT